MCKRFWLSLLLDSCYFVTKLSLALILRAIRCIRSRSMFPVFLSYAPYSQMADTREKLVPSHESKALQDKQFLQKKTFSELAEFLARLPPEMTLCAFLFKYDYAACLQTLMVFFPDFLWANKTDVHIFKETGWFCTFPKHQTQHDK